MVNPNKLNQTNVGYNVNFCPKDGLGYMCALRFEAEPGRGYIYPSCTDCLGDSLVERPAARSTAGGKAAEEVGEDLLADIDGAGGTAHALVDDEGGGGLAASADGDGLAAHGVAVGLGAHLLPVDGDEVLGGVIASVVNTARAETDSVVGDVAVEAAAAAASAAATSSRLAGARRGRRRGARSRSRRRRRSRRGA